MAALDERLEAAWLIHFKKANGFKYDTAPVHTAKLDVDTIVAEKAMLSATREIAHTIPLATAEVTDWATKRHQTAQMCFQAGEWGIDRILIRPSGSPTSSRACARDVMGSH